MTVWVVMEDTIVGPVPNCVFKTEQQAINYCNRRNALEDDEYFYKIGVDFVE